MTEQLKTLMHQQADSVDFTVPDLDAMVRTGDRRRRTRRLGAAGAVAATVAGVALVATTLTPGQRAVEPAAPAAPAAPLSWVDGSTLHLGTSGPAPTSAPGGATSSRTARAGCGRGRAAT
jgi:hypothetical protein